VRFDQAPAGGHCPFLFVNGVDSGFDHELGAGPGPYRLGVPDDLRAPGQLHCDSRLPVQQPGVRVDG
jgi:hypothetical protein